MAGNPTIAANSGGYGTAQATTSGTQFDFNSVVPSWATEVTIYLKNTSLSGTDSYLIRIGPSAGLITTGYLSSSGTTESTLVATVDATVGFIVFASVAADGMSGFLTLKKGADNFWYFSHAVKRGGLKTSFGGGYVDIGGPLDKIRIMTTGANTWDNGEVNISWR